MNKQYPYDVAGNYTFDVGKIEVVGGVAKLRNGFWEEETRQGGSYVRATVVYNGKIYVSIGNTNTIIKEFDDITKTWVDSFGNLEPNSASTNHMQVYNGKLYIGVPVYDVSTTSWTTYLYEFDGTSWTKGISFSGSNNLGFEIFNSNLLIEAANATYLYDGATLSSSLGFAVKDGDSIVNNGILYFRDGSAGFSSYDGFNVNNIGGVLGQMSAIEAFNGNIYVADINDRFYKYSGTTLDYISATPGTVYNMVVFNNFLYMTAGGLYKYDEVSITGVSTGYTYDSNLTKGLLFNSKLYWFESGFNADKMVSLELGYSFNKPTVEISTLYAPGDSISWDLFSEILGTGNQGTIGYNLYKGDKTNKYYWNGTAWAIGGSSSNYNSAATISANISSFDTIPTSIGYIAYLISDGLQAVELDSNTIAYSVNTAPLVNAGLNKTVKDNKTLKPFSDALFSDPDGTIIKAEYKVIGEVDTWAEIIKGSYGTLLEAVQNFQYQFVNVGTKTVQLQVTDNSSVPNGTQSDSLTVEVQKYNVVITVQDQLGRELKELLVQQTAAEGYVARTSPFTLQYEYSSIPGEVVIKKEGYGVSLRSIDIADYSKTIVISPGGDSIQLEDIIPDIAEVPKHDPSLAEAISFLYRYFRLRRGRKWWNMKRFIIRG